MITKDIISTITALDPYQRDRFRSVGLFDHAGVKSAPTETGSVIKGMLPYANLFVNKHILLLKLDNGTLITYLLVGMYERELEKIPAYRNRTLLPMLIIKGRIAEMHEENVPMIASIASGIMKGKEDTAWMNDGVIEFLTVLPINRSAEPDVFAKFLSNIAMNIELSRPFDIKRDKIKISNWKILITGIIKSSYSK